MKNVLMNLIQIVLIILFCEIGFCNCLGDINTIIDCKCVTDYNDKTEIEQMDTIIFGSYPQNDISGLNKEPIEWIVIEKNNNKALLLSKYVLDHKCYHYAQNTGKVSWKDTDIREWLNNDFFTNAFSQSEKDRIINIIITDERNGDTSNDNVFLLSLNDLKKYFSNSKGIFEYYSKKMGTYATAYAKNVDNNGWPGVYHGLTNENKKTWWWVLSVGHDSNLAHGVSGNGMQNFRYYDGSVGVRPAIWVNLNTSVSGNKLNNSNSIQDKVETKTYSASINNNNATSINSVEPSNGPRYDPNHKKQLGHASKDRLDLSKITAVGFPGNKPNGWIGDYYYENGAVVKNQWRQYNSDWYYCGETGAILKNQWIDNTYYVDSNGKMLKNTTTPDGYKVGNDGKYIEETKKTFTNQASKNVLGDNVHIEEADVYLNPDGSYQIGGTPEEGATMVQSGGNHKVRDDIVSVQLSLDIEMVKCVGEYDDNTTIDKIETVKFGAYPQKNKSSKDLIEWVVLEKKEGKALLLSKYILDTKRYDERDTWDANCNYFNSSIREGLNNTFYRNAFNDEEKKSILENSEVNNDKVFSLSVGECVKYFKVKSNYYHEYPQNKKIATKGTNYALNGAEQVYWSDTKIDWEKHKLVKSTEGWSKGNSRFWLRTNSSKKNIIDCDGAFYTIPNEVSFTGVRPAIWVKYEGPEYIVNETTINEDDYLPKKPDVTFEIFDDMIDSVKMKSDKEFLFFGNETNYVEVKFSYCQDAITSFDMNNIKRIDDNCGFIIQKIETNNSGESVKIYVNTKEEAQIISDNINSKRYYALKFYK